MTSTNRDITRTAVMEASVRQHCSTEAAWILCKAAAASRSDRLSDIRIRVALVFTPGGWDAFTAGVNDGEFKRP
ncbi:hypothetical protein ABTW96_20865 [Nocardia beijingensis]|uniref:hypothetical protein n=1 Tax=Nocardia beijingensis TaxID=95162 RepID=UPI0033236F00